MTYGSGNSGDYKKLKGQMIQVTDTDPVVYAGTWATGGAMNTARSAVGSSTSGSQTASLVFGGQASDPALSDNTEQYNGTSWTEVADLNQIRAGLAGVGTTTAAAAAMGDSREIPSSPNVFYTQHEQWDGSSWTETTEVNAGRSFAFSFGTAPAFLVVGGYGTPGFTAKATAEEWNGSGWTEVADLNTARVGLGGAGTTTAGIAAGGPSGQTEQWNGSSWTEVGDFSTGRGAGMCVGTNTAALAFGGSPVPGGKGVLTEEWNGTSWTELNDLSTGRDYFGGSGTTTSALAFGGNPGYKTDTEEWSFPSAPAVQEGQLWIKTATGANSVMKGYQAQGTGAWASGNNLNTARGFLTGAGTQTAALAMSGYEGPPEQPSVDVESYDGSSWTEIANVNVARLEVGAFGSQTAANFVGGYAPTAPGRVSSNESWNGTSWTEVTNMPATTDNLMQGAGTSTAGMIVGGQTAPGAGNKTTNNVFYDGTNWTQAASLNAAKTLHATMGNQTSAIVASGLTGSPTASTVNVEQWNGTAWTEVANVSQARYRLVGAGTGGDAIVFAGTNFPSTTFYTLTESWNGSSWTEIGDMSTGREGGASTNSGTGNSRSALLAGGSLGSPVTAVTEEWTVPFVTKAIGTD